MIGDTYPSVVLSYGLGVDSTAILLRWLLEPASRDFDLDDLVVVTAMTGDEWAQTGVDVEAHVLPLLRAHGVRFVQVARAGRHVARDGITVLDDSRCPQRLFLEGAFKLSDEHLSTGTVPQTGGSRLCSVHAKGDALDPTIARLTGGLPYRHVVGFEANEPGRAYGATRRNGTHKPGDVDYNTDLRTGVYPLIEWGWDRAACEAYIEQVTGVAWQKSACKFCPFALANKAGRAAVLSRYEDEPAAGVETLFMEHVALCLNPTQALVGKTRAVDVVRKAGLTDVLDAFAARVAEAPSALYEVRRIWHGRSNADRSVRAVAAGDRDAMLAELDAVAALEGASVEVGDDGIARAWTIARDREVFPSAERMFVVAPAVVEDKAAAGFDRSWGVLVGEVEPELALF